MGGNMQLQQLMELLGMGAAQTPHTQGQNAYYGGVQRQPYQADQRFMPSQQTAGMPQGMPMDPMAMMAQGPQPADPLGMQQAPPQDLAMMLGGMGLG